MNAQKINFSKLEKALQSLKSALTPPPANDRERDGAIQRFEYTFELIWKVAKKTLEINGIESQTPRTIFRDLAQVGWISQPELWFDFLEARNKTRHNYREDIAEEVFKKTQAFAIEAEALLVILKAKSS
jgi:nucleotidyltransferase substrate binding protein (TIGR01987 family)